ncbi:UbiA-like protein EboC [Jiulongibacter sediminis]|jgi:4-hydroxybenzoate polyprenyltransferase|uniref:UbiA-like protein EboC n=1 Tax=Jiulongibacter sediminis TaxID=1605367 RepID=UPI0026ED8F2B|nr:UbiA-like protein EboC [Jiulongibacter sediminis]
MGKLFGFLRLMRPANVVTALADIAAGLAISGFLTVDSDSQNWQKAAFLFLSTIGLYGGGVVLNDVFDAPLDAIERPERPIPSGKISLTEGAILGSGLLLLGILSALIAGVTSFWIALTTALFVILYDKWAKHSNFLGPLTMGICRGLNLLLGMSLFWPELTMLQISISLIPVFFIAAITLTSQGEVHGSNKKSIGFALTIDSLIFIVLVVLSHLNFKYLWYSLPFIAFWYFLNLRAKSKAIRNNIPENIKKAVKTGVISLIPLNAAYTAIFGTWYHALAVLCLLPVSLWLAKRFAVT